MLLVEVIKCGKGIEMSFKFINRELVFNSGRAISNELGNIAQNEMLLRETDILVEFIAVDKLIEQCLEYKRILVKELKQVY